MAQLQVKIHLQVLLQLPGIALSAKQKTELAALVTQLLTRYNYVIFHANWQN